MTLTTEEMKNSTEFLDDLNGKLEEASVELEQINQDEDLLGWPLTSASNLPVLIDTIQPYCQLWNVTYQFHNSYDLWYRGTVPSQSS